MVSQTRSYRRWANMIQRCTNSNRRDYARYGGRGITVCARWRSFENFPADVGECPPGMTLDRVRNDEGYGPDNWRWSTQRQQCRNQEKTVLIEINGVVRPRIEWCEQYGIPEYVVRRRINGHGWDAVAAVTTPIKSRQRDEAGRITWA